MSPEQNHGGLVTPKSDVWGIGAVLFAAATGEAPFDHDETTTSQPQADVPFAPLRRLRRVPRAFAAVVDSCLAVDPNQRPSIPELTTALTYIVAACRTA
jgi:serine/threonine protein kinase